MQTEKIIITATTNKEVVRRIHLGISTKVTTGRCRLVTENKGRIFSVNSDFVFVHKLFIFIRRYLLYNYTCAQKDWRSIDLEQQLEDSKSGDMTARTAAEPGTQMKTRNHKHTTV